MTGKFIRFFTYLFLLTFPLGQIGRIRLEENISFLPQDLFASAIFLGIIFSYKKKWRDLLKDKFLVCQLYFLGFGVLSLVFNTFFFKDIHFYTAVLYAVRYVVYLSFLLVGPFFKESKNIKKVIFFVMYLFIFIGLGQFFVFNDLRWAKFLEWDTHLYRLFSTLLDPNYSGVVYFMMLLLILHEDQKIRIYKNPFGIIGVFISLMTVYLTYSRTAIIALIASFASFTILKKRFVLFFSVLILALIAGSLLTDTTIEGLNPFRTVSSKERIKSLNEGLSVSSHHFFTGVGFNAYRDAQIRYGFRNTIGASKSNADAGTDNSFVFVFATTGLLGLILFCCSYYFLLRKLLLERTTISTMLACCVIGLLAAANFLNVLFYSQIIAWIFICIALRKQLA